MYAAFEFVLHTAPFFPFGETQVHRNIASTTDLPKMLLGMFDALISSYQVATTYATNFVKEFHHCEFACDLEPRYFWFLTSMLTTKMGCEVVGSIEWICGTWLPSPFVCFLAFPD
tara:strand:- start:430 stop:774 length:345 start_codon:yes stop_codon:yes gene_type:complete